MKLKTKLFRWLELTLLFGGTPLLLYNNLIPFHHLIFLGVVFSVYLYIILRDKSFKRHQFRLNGFKAWRIIYYRTSIIVLFLLTYVWFTFPEQFFHFPAKDTWLWAILMILYPLTSVIPQEFVFRVYFYHRFIGLTKSRNLLILINAGLFSFSHIMYNNWVVIIFTFIASILFSLTYLRYRSFTITVLEHALYGNLVFTIGPGSFFYNGY